MTFAVAIIFGAIGPWRMWSGQAASPVSRPVIAVLPFENLRPAEDEAGINGVVGHSIFSSLAGYSGFDAIARQSSFRLRGAERDIVEVGDALGADYLVQSSQSLVDRNLRLSVQLIDASDGTLKMVDAFEIPLQDLFETDDRIAHHIANTVSGSVVNLNARTERRKDEVDALILDNRARLLFRTGARHVKNGWPLSTFMMKRLKPIPKSSGATWARR